MLDIHKKALRQVNADMGLDDADMDNIEEVYINAHGEFLVGEYQGKVVAMGALRKVSEDTVELKRMRVDPAHQGRGFGKQMLLHLEKRARELGYKTIVLDTTKGQIVANEMYQKHGYKETGRKHWKGYEVIFYKKELL